MRELEAREGGDCRATASGRYLIQIIYIRLSRWSASSIVIYIKSSRWPVLSILPPKDPPTPRHPGPSLPKRPRSHASERSLPRVDSKHFYMMFITICDIHVRLFTQYNVLLCVFIDRRDSSTGWPQDPPAPQRENLARSKCPLRPRGSWKLPRRASRAGFGWARRVSGWTTSCASAKRRIAKPPKGQGGGRVRSGAAALRSAGSCLWRPPRSEMPPRDPGLYSIML